MPIQEIPGDILTLAPPGSPLTLVCHQVNCRGVMGHGLALQIRERYPVVFESYRKKCAANALFGGKPRDLLGQIQVVPLLQEAGFAVVNIFGQDKYGRDRCHTDYLALRRAFSTLAARFPQAVVRLPCKFACGLAGGDWDTVYGIIRDKLDGKVRQVEIWKLEERN